jgi:hypothetical protein
MFVMYAYKTVRKIPKIYYFIIIFCHVCPQNYTKDTEKICIHSSPPTLSMTTCFYDPGVDFVFCYRLMILVQHKHNCFQFNRVCTFQKRSEQYIRIGLYSYCMYSITLTSEMCTLLPISSQCHQLYNCI